MVPADDPIAFCMACRLNDTIPDLRKPENRVYWAKIETAKRRLVYSLLRFGLPIKTKAEDPEAGARVRFLGEPGGARSLGARGQCYYGARGRPHYSQYRRGRRDRARAGSP